MTMPNSFHTSASGASITPALISPWFTSPCRRSSVTQAKARTSTLIQSGTSTASSHQRCAPGDASAIT